MTAEKILVTVDSDLEDLIPGFLANRKKDLGALKQAVTDNNTETIRSIGHSLKGVGGGYGFMLLSEIGADLEQKAKSGELDGVTDLLARMEDYLERIEVVYE